MYGSLYRHLLLPVFDGWVKGRQTMTHWQQAERRQWLPRQELEAAQLTALQQLVAHAEKTCPYYASLWQSHGLTATNLQSLADFQRWPLLTRESLRKHRLQLRTQAPLKLMAKSTGGSSGEPVHFDLDSGSNDRRTALMYRGYGWAGGQPGSRQLFIWGTALNSVSRWKRWKISLHHRFDHHRVLSCFEFTPDKMPGHVRQLNAYRPEVIVAYTNPLYELARYVDAHGLAVHQPRSLIVGAEKLHDFQRELIERVFRAPVFETYGSREFMLIGAECPEHNGLHLSIDNLLVEILDEAGQPTPPGEEGQVVITDLYNYGMPFIRYVNGDRAVAGFSDCACGRGLPLLQRVVGRQLDILQTPDGRRIPGEFFPHLLKDYPVVQRFQVVQTELTRITLKIVAAGGLALADRERLLQDIRSVAGRVVEIDLQQVTDIPLTKAGKLKVVVNELASERHHQSVTRESAATIAATGTAALTAATSATTGARLPAVSVVSQNPS